MYEKITPNNVLMYAIKNYDNPHCEGEKEFEDDLKRFKYIKRLLRKYYDTKVLKERLLLNKPFLRLKPDLNQYFKICNLAHYPLCYLALSKRTEWDSNPRYLLNTTVFKTIALNHSAIHPNIIISK